MLRPWLTAWRGQYLHGFLSVVVLTTLVSSPAMAAPSNFGELLNHITSTTFSPVWLFMKGLFGVLGICLLAKGLVGLYTSVARPGGATITGAFAWIAAGLFVISLLSFADIVSNTLALDSEVGGRTSFQTGAMGSASGSDFFSKLGMFFAIVSGPLSALVVATCFIIGIWFIYSGVTGAAHSVDVNSSARGRNSLSGSLVSVVIGVLLAHIPLTSSIVSLTFGFSDHSEQSLLASSTNAATAMMSYSGSASEDFWGAAGGAAQAIGYGLVPFGLIALARGLIIMRRVSNGNARNESLGSAFTHIIAGVALMDIIRIGCMGAATFGHQAPGFCS